MKKLNRLVSLVLCAAMLLGMFPLTAWAVNNKDGTVTIPAVTEKSGRYVLTNTFAPDKTYLIASSGTDGNAQLLTNNKGQVGSTAVKVERDSSGTYYIADGNYTNALWTNSSEYLVNQGKYLGYTRNGWSCNLVIGNDQCAWTWNNNSLRFTDWFTTYYLGYDNNWSIGRQSSRNVYLYVYEEYDVETEPAHEYQLTADPKAFQIGQYGGTIDIASQLYKDGELCTDELNGTYSYEVTEGKAYITVDSTGKVTARNQNGTGTVKVSYSWTDNDGETHTVWDLVDVTVYVPFYTVDIQHNGQSISVLPVKRVTNTTKVQLTADVLKDDETLVENPTITWRSENESVVKVSETGELSFEGKDGVATIVASYVVGGQTYTDYLTVSASTGIYIIPSDGTNDFPEYPNEGSVRLDKTAKAVGNFHDTGIAQVELSMTGVPYTTNNEIDVVIMLDMSTSMTDTVDRKTPAIAAARAALETIVKNENGTFNGNRVAIYGFNGWFDNASSDTYSSHKEHIYENNCKTCQNITRVSVLQSYDQAKYNTTYNAISTNYNLDAGTNYAIALKQCYQTLAAAKNDGIGNNRKQFVIFMTDGAASTGFAYVDSSNKGYSVYETGYLGTDGFSNIGTVAGKTEYYSTQMKNSGVTIYTVGVQIQGSSTNSTTRAQQTKNAKTVLQKIAGTSEGNATEAEFSDYAIFVDQDPSELVEAFRQAAISIKEAAKDVKVVDEIHGDYTMVFEPPIDGDLPDGQEFYIEVLDYTLKPQYGEDGTTIVDYYRDTAKSLMKLYMGSADGKYYAASDANGKAFAAPVFEAKPLGSLYYWTTTATDSGVSVEVDGVTYYFDANGKKQNEDGTAPDGWFNLTSGAYASGTVTSTPCPEDPSKEYSVSQDLIIATPYFVYNASNRMLVWTLEKLSGTEFVLQYFLYLTGAKVGTLDPEAGTYDTNEKATLAYENFQNNYVQQEFPIPQMTWHGAQVTYVFYLVNSMGQPVNRAGRVVPFSEAVYITEPRTDSVVWTEGDQRNALVADTLAKDLVPSVYTLFDETAYYSIHVFANESDANSDNHFQIGGDSTKVQTTYVFNTKADRNKYTAIGTYAKPGVQTVKCSVEGSNHHGLKPDYHTQSGLDYYDTTVAFAVLWIPAMGEDEIVVDYGLDVVVDVTQNDLAAATPVGLLATAPTEPDGTTVVINNGQFAFNKHNASQSLNLMIGSNHIATASLEGKHVRIKLNRESGMHFTEYLQFYYVSEVQYYDSRNVLQTTYLYTYVRVIPATSMYYEEDYIKFAGDWTNPAGDPDPNATQDVDRPGPNKLGAGYDADNPYGYDNAYRGCTEYSLNSAKVTTVQDSVTAFATFDFTGTGFDLIGRTDNETTSIVVTVDDAVEPIFVDTYYKGADGVNAINQVPVVTVRNLNYGFHTVSVEVVLNNDEGADFAHGATGKFYLDAVRIYDPALVVGYVPGDTVAEAYKMDGECYPKREEFGNEVLKQYGADKMFSFVTFVDREGKTDDINLYQTWGPNNELYLAAEQSIRLTVDGTFQPNLITVPGVSEVADVQIGFKLASGSSTTVTILNDKGVRIQKTLNSATDLNFSIKDCFKDGETITITNSGSDLLSITTIKVTLAPAEANTSYFLADQPDEMPTEPVEENQPEEPTEAPETTPESPNAVIARGILKAKETFAAVIIAVSNGMESLSNWLQDVAESIFAGGG